MKFCAKCKIEKTKENSSLSKSRIDGFCQYCKRCYSERRSSTKHVEERSVKNKKYYLSNKERKVNKDWGNTIKRKFNLTPEEYFFILKNQNNKCYICDKDQSELNRKLAVDHDHTSGKVRGLLCTNCNIGLGYFKDSPKLLKEAIKYLEKYE